MYQRTKENKKQRNEPVIYGYARISTKAQSIERQLRNIKAVAPQAVMFSEAYTGTSANRPEWDKLLRKVKQGDSIIFDSVSRMSRNASDGYAVYKELFEKGVTLEFLKEPYINTSVFRSAQENSIEKTGNDIADIYIEATNKVLFLLAENQIKLAFEQAEKEVEDLHKRTSEGMLTAKLNGKQVGRTQGKKYCTEKSAECKKEILKHSKNFGGSLNDTDLIKLLGISKKTYYKYKKEFQN